MNLSGPHLNSRLPQSRQRGMAVIVVIAILAIVSIYIVGNLATLHHLGRDLRLIEQKQLRRLESVHVRGSGTGPSAAFPAHPIQIVDAMTLSSTPQAIPVPPTLTVTTSSISRLQERSSPRVLNP